MPAFAPRQARGLAFVSLALALCASACSPSPEARARTLDAAAGTGIFSWLVAHEPSALVVAGVAVERVRPLDPAARIGAAASGPLGRACRAALRAHALLFVVYPRERAARAAATSDALDCGYALARDPGGIVVAPR